MMRKRLEQLLVSLHNVGVFLLFMWFILVVLLFTLALLMWDDFTKESVTMAETYRGHEIKIRRTRTGVGEWAADITGPCGAVTVTVPDYKDGARQYAENLIDGHFGDPRKEANSMFDLTTVKLELRRVMEDDRGFEDNYRYLVEAIDELPIGVAWYE